MSISNDLESALNEGYATSELADIAKGLADQIRAKLKSEKYATKVVVKKMANESLVQAKLAKEDFSSFDKIKAIVLGFKPEDARAVKYGVSTYGDKQSSPMDMEVTIHVYAVK